MLFTFRKRSDLTITSGYASFEIVKPDTVKDPTNVQVADGITVAHVLEVGVIGVPDTEVGENII